MVGERVCMLTAPRPDLPRIQPWVLAVPALVGAILLVMVWLSLGPAGTQTSVDRNDVVWACRRKVLPGYRDVPREARNDFAEARKDFAKGMRKDCGIYGPQATRTSGD
jgi:hypothetical protein